MKKTEELLRFETDLTNDAELAKKFDQAAKDAIDSNECKCDGEVLSKAAKSLGYDISPADFERASAEIENLDPEELQQASGGAADWCLTNYMCAVFYHQINEDEKGHNTFCLAVWHCFTAMLHTETESNEVSCMKDYRCIFSYLDYWGNPITERKNN